MGGFDGAMAMARATVERARNMGRWLMPKDRDDNLRKDALDGEALERITDSAGWKLMLTQLQERRDAHIKSMMHDKDKNRDELCARAAELDSVLAWVDETIRAGRVAREQLESKQRE